MPSITTHHFFSKEVLNKLDLNVKSKFNNELTIYHTFAQSHDYLFYYFLDKKNGKRIRDLGHTGHHKNTQEYLLNIVKNIKENHLEDNQQAVAYLYGSITHYVLDTTCHPFIFYKTGVRRIKDDSTKKYRGEHNHMEKDIDAFYWEKYTRTKYNKCNLNRDIIKNPYFTDELTKLISLTYKQTYNEDNIGIWYQKSIKSCKRINAIFINDYFGTKRLLYRFIDFISNNRFGILASYSTHILNPNKDFLNTEHKEWNHPSYKDEKYTYSFNDLFNLSIDKSVRIINAIDKVLYHDKPIDTLKELIPNIDYSTGKEIGNHPLMNYFEY